MPDPNPFTEDADQTGDVFDITTPSRTIAPPPPPPAAVAPPVVTAPAARRVAAPSPMDIQMQQLRTQFANLPMAQANEAVSAALKFQATRGYQNDLQNGMAPAEALAKWAPMMFTAPKSSNLGQAASFIRATTPQVRDIGGVGYRIPPQGNAIPITPPKQTVPKPPPGLAPDLADARKTLDGYVKEIEKAEASDDVTLKAQLPRLRQRRTDLENYVQAKELLQAPPQTALTAPQPAAPASRIRVKNKAGKTGTIPASQLDAALAAGYSRVQ